MKPLANSAGLPPLIVSRADRIGDLVLSLPALGYLRDLGFADRVLHVAPYCRDIAEWARYNGLCTAVWVTGAEPPVFRRAPVALSLVYLPAAVRDLRRARPAYSLGPRTRLSALWNFSRSVPQHRSRVQKSEMAYNVDLAGELARALGAAALPAFRGLAALNVPAEWTATVAGRAAPDVVFVVANRGSAQNWPIETYIERGLAARAAGRQVHFLVSGDDAGERLAALRRARVEEHGCRIETDFAALSELVAYLARAGEVVCSSTGPLHIAHAAGVAVTGIYPRLRVQSFERWRPDGYWHGSPVRIEEIGDAEAPALSPSGRLTANGDPP